MAELFLVRHGQASFGTDDYDRLSDVGVQQGVWLGEYLARAHAPFD
ncbi:histidine phosphatase family protein, partial [Burkholderia multivorans]|nr:histidine phosphatase family protein [Burkholderia multivorans]